MLSLYSLSAALLLSIKLLLLNMPVADSPLVPGSHGARQPMRSAWDLDRLRHERATALGFALETRTQHVYNSSTISWLNFCKLHNFPNEPNADTLSIYATWMCGAEHPVKPSIVVGHLSGICSNLEPFYPAIRQIRSDKLVSRTLAGLKKRSGTAAKEKCAIPVQEVSDIYIMLASCGYDDLLFLAILLADFHGLHCLGELCWPNEKEFQSYRRLVARHSVQRFIFLIPFAGA